MQRTLKTLSLSFFFVTFTTAAGTCTSSGAISWPPTGDCSLPLKFDTLVENCRACCLNDGDCFQTCVEASGINDPNNDPSDLIKRDIIGAEHLGAIREKRDLSSRASTLSCSTNEGCYQYTDGSLLCLNLGTGLYHDDVGGNGDYYSGEYTGPDGKVQTGTSAATATAGSEGSQSTGSVVSSRATSTASTGATSAAGASASSASASATSQGSADVLRVGANLGLVGLVAGLFL